jgi:hypothetical protein
MLCLNLLGKSVLPNAMIAEFETDTHFRTYTAERNSSFSANCNVLNALLHVPDPNMYSSQISKAATFLCDSWCDGTVRDKWVCNTGMRMGSIC